MTKMKTIKLTDLVKKMSDKRLRGVIGSEAKIKNKITKDMYGRDAEALKPVLKSFFNLAKEESSKRAEETALKAHEKYKTAHPGVQGRPSEGNKRAQERAEGHMRKEARHYTHMVNYAATHPVHEIPVTVDGKTTMVPTTHRYAGGMEIKNGNIVSQTFTYKGNKTYNYTLDKGDNSKHAEKFVSGLSKTVEPTALHGGYSVGANMNAAIATYNVKKVKGGKK